MDKQDALDLIAAVRSGEFEDATVEVKRSRRGLPQRLYEALSAFANRPTGGVIVLGLDEAQQFAVTGVEDVQTVLTELTTLSARMMPPIALDVAVVEVEEHRRQRTALAYLYRHEQMTNGDYCRLNNVDPGLATRELRGLVENGVVTMQGSRRWAYYTLEITPQPEKQSPGPLWQGYDLNPRQQAALAFLQEHGTITTAQYIALTEVIISEQMARKDLRTLIQLGLIRRMGQARSTQYVLADTR